MTFFKILFNSNEALQLNFYPSFTFTEGIYCVKVRLRLKVSSSNFKGTGERRGPYSFVLTYTLILCMYINV